jgi:hypothetical protein
MARPYEGTNIADLPEGEELHEDLNDCDLCGTIVDSETELRWQGYAEVPEGFWKYAEQQHPEWAEREASPARWSIIIAAICGDCYDYCLEQYIYRGTDRGTEGYALQSVGTWIRADGWTYPLLVGGGYDNDEGGAHHISNIDPEDEGHEWWQRLSPADRKIVEAVKVEVSKNE